MFQDPLLSRHTFFHGLVPPSLTSLVARSSLSQIHLQTQARGEEVGAQKKQAVKEQLSRTYSLSSTGEQKHRMWRLEWSWEIKNSELSVEAEDNTQWCMVDGSWVRSKGDGTDQNRYLFLLRLPTGTKPSPVSDPLARRESSKCFWLNNQKGHTPMANKDSVHEGWAHSL